MTHPSFMRILLPEHTTVDDIVFWTAELIVPGRTTVARQQADTILDHRRAVVIMR
ncbi:MAG: hypothetical protein ABEI86_01610 [Halobacteriaceae archaeon]